MRWIFYTVGTTGEPKGALHTRRDDHRRLARRRRRATASTERDRYPMVFPFTHIGGIGMLCVAAAHRLRARSSSSSTTRRRTPPFLAAHGVTLAAGGTPLALAYLQQQRKHPDEPLFPRAARAP